VIGPIVDALTARSEPFRILLLPDHATPCTIKTHTAESVPYLLFDSTLDGRVASTPSPRRGEPARAAHELMGPPARSGLTTQESLRRPSVHSERPSGSCTARPAGCKVISIPRDPGPAICPAGAGFPRSFRFVSFAWIVGIGPTKAVRTSEGTVAGCVRSGARAHGATP
jgi:hypothetical protein